MIRVSEIFTKKVYCYCPQKIDILLCWSFLFYIENYIKCRFVKKIYLLPSLFLRKQLTIRYSITILVEQSLCPLFGIRRFFLYTYRVSFRHRSLFSMFVQQLSTANPTFHFCTSWAARFFRLRAFFPVYKYQYTRHEKLLFQFYKRIYTHLYYFIYIWRGYNLKYILVSN